MVEAFQIFRLQRPDGIAIVGGYLGQFLIAASDINEARQVLGDSLAAASKLGWVDRAQQIEQLIRSLPPDGAADGAAAELRIPSDDPALGTAVGHRAWSPARCQAAGLQPVGGAGAGGAGEPGVLDDLGQFAVAEGGRGPFP